MTQSHNSFFTELGYIGIGSTIEVTWSNGVIMNDRIVLDRESPTPIKIFRSTVNVKGGKTKEREYSKFNLAELREYYEMNRLVEVMAIVEIKVL